MEPVRIRDDVDPNSPEYRRRLIIVIMIVLGLSVVGGLWLGYKIRSAENVEDDAAQEQPVDEQRSAPETNQRSGESD